MNTESAHLTSRAGSLAPPTRPESESTEASFTQLSESERRIALNEMSALSYAELPQPLSDEERELHIKHCGEQMRVAMARYEAHGCLSDRGEADRFRLLMEEAIKGRSEAQVNRMERRLGLA